MYPGPVQSKLFEVVEWSQKVFTQLSYYLAIHIHGEWRMKTMMDGRNLSSTLLSSRADPLSKRCSNNSMKFVNNRVTVLYVSK